MRKKIHTVYLNMKQHNYKRFMFMFMYITLQPHTFMPSFLVVTMLFFFKVIDFDNFNQPAILNQILFLLS